MTKLNQLLAVAKGAKAARNTEITHAHHQSQRLPLLSGLSRTYTPKDDEGERLPQESTLVQLTAQNVLAGVKASMAKLFDLTAAIDFTNCVAAADVVVDGTVLVVGAPVTYLLFLEKQLIDLGTVVDKLPVLDPSERWAFSESAGYYVSDQVQTARTKKIPRNHVKAPATDKHPAQVDVYTEDVIVGTWTLVKFSGALPAVEIRALKARIETVLTAVKYAREQANETEVVDPQPGKAVLDYIMG